MRNLSVGGIITGRTAEVFGRKPAPMSLVHYKPHMENI
jgi:hypothetical protein